MSTDQSAQGVSTELPDEFWNLVENLRCQRTGDPVESAHTKLEEYVQDLIHAERKATTAEAKGSIDRLADILRRTANAIRGEPPESIVWGWKDLHERAAALVSERDALASRVRELEVHAKRWEMLAYMHTRGVTFHVYEHYIGNPDRLDYAATLHREYLAGELARAALTTTSGDSHE